MFYFSDQTASALDWTLIKDFLKKEAILKKTKNFCEELRGLSPQSRLRWTQVTNNILALKRETFPNLSSSFQNCDLDHIFHSIQNRSDHHPDDFQIFFLLLIFHEKLQKFWNQTSLRFPDCQSPSLKDLQIFYLQFFNEKGWIKDDATKDLKRIRAALFKKREQSLKKLKDWMQKPFVQKYLQDRHIQTQANTHLVLLKQEGLKDLKGTIFFESRSGQTCFFEPEEIQSERFVLNELIQEEKKEIQKIKKTWCEEIERQRHLILSALKTIEKADELSLRLKWARLCEGQAAYMEHENRSLIFKNMKNPLFLTRRDFMKPFAFEVDFSDSNGQAVIVSGPNAGGKTILLKTLGQNFLLAINGFFVCADVFQTPSFQHFFASIGDQQSLTEDLSSFSGFIQSFVRDFEQVRNSSVFLFDELFACTEPNSASDLSWALIDFLIEQKHFVMVSTHLPSIKSLKGKHYQQISFDYDLEKDAPTYELRVGEAGLSYAFEVARKWNFPEPILTRAENQFFEKGEEYQIDTWRKRLDQKEKKLLKKAFFLKEKEKEIVKKEKESQIRIKNKEEEKKANWRKKENQMLHKLREYETKLKRDLEAKWKENFQNLSESEKKLKIKRKTKSKNQHISFVPKTLPLDTKEVKSLEVGDLVWSEKLKVQGLITEIQKNKVLLSVGNVKMQTSLVDLKFLKKQKEKAKDQVVFSHKKKKKQHLDSYHSYNFSGYRVEQALEELDQILDEAYQNQIPFLLIQHGTSGQLKNAIRQFLNDFKRLPLYWQSHLSFDGSDALTKIIFGQK